MGSERTCRLQAPFFGAPWVGWSILRKDQEFSGRRGTGKHILNTWNRPRWSGQELMCTVCWGNWEQFWDECGTQEALGQRGDRLQGVLGVKRRSLGDKEPKEDFERRTQDNFATNFADSVLRGGDFKWELSQKAKRAVPVREGGLNAATGRMTSGGLERLMNLALTFLQLHFCLWC